MSLSPSTMTTWGEKSATQTKKSQWPISKQLRSSGEWGSKKPVNPLSHFQTKDGGLPRLYHQQQ